jgi:hypothetical protein
LVRFGHRAERHEALFDGSETVCDVIDSMSRVGVGLDATRKAISV